MSQPTRSRPPVPALRGGDLVTIRLANARVIAADPSRELLVVRTPGGQILSVTVPQPGLHITCLTSGHEPEPAGRPVAEQCTSLLVDIDALPAVAGPVQPRPMRDPALRDRDGDE